MAGRLTTHVLDTAQGRPAQNMQITLWRVDSQLGEKIFLLSAQTNQDGRTDGPLLMDLKVQIGIYELLFGVGEYFAQFNLPLTDPPFLDEVPIRFSIADAEAHYHVPLLVSPWSYSTYRGS
jgi:5-hydroxyisourate hydrolase